MSLTCHVETCRYCLLHVDECACEYCDECFAHLATIWGNDGGYCKRCRDICASCCDPVLPGERMCLVCAHDEPTIALLGLKTRGVA